MDRAADAAALRETYTTYAIAPERINTDDFYVIDASNHELVAHYGSKGPEPIPRVGQRVLRGMQLRSVDKPPVWQIPSVPAFLSRAL